MADKMKECNVNHCPNRETEKRSNCRHLTMNNVHKCGLLKVWNEDPGSGITQKQYDEIMEKVKAVSETLYVSGCAPYDGVALIRLKEILKGYII